MGRIRYNCVPPSIDTIRIRCEVYGVVVFVDRSGRIADIVYIVAIELQVGSRICMDAGTLPGTIRTREVISDDSPSSHTDQIHRSESTEVDSGKDPVILPT